MKFAMIMKGRVIDIVEQDVAPVWPPDDKGNEVKAVICDETVKVGMHYDEQTGGFAVPIPAEYIPNQLTRIEILLNTSRTEVENAAIDAYTEELIEGGLL